MIKEQFHDFITSKTGRYLIRLTLTKYESLIRQVAQAYLGDDGVLETYLRKTLAQMSLLEFSATQHYESGHVPLSGKFHMHLIDEMYKRSALLPELRTKTTQSDRIIQPTMGFKDNDDRVTNSDRHTTIDTITEVIIPLNKRGYQFSWLELLEYVAENPDRKFAATIRLAELVAEQLVPDFEYHALYGQGGVMNDDRVFKHRSGGMQTVAGYCLSEGGLTGDSMKAVLFHLPRGYRQRAKWVMNKRTGKQLLQTFDSEDNPIVNHLDEENQKSDLPVRVLGKPILYVDDMPDVRPNAIPIILADWSRGYISSYRSDTVHKDTHKVNVTANIGIAGQVLQPASFKGVKIV